MALHQKEHELTPIRSTRHPASCTPMSSHDDVFLSSTAKQSRPALRPTLSHNTVFHSPTPIWPRRALGGNTSASIDEIVNPANSAHQSAAISTPARPLTAGTILDAPGSQASYPPLPPPAPLSSSAPSSNGIHIPIPNNASAASEADHQGNHEAPSAAFTTLSTNPPAANQHPISSSYPPITHDPYNDELSFHTSYSTSYDSSFSSGTSGSPWAHQPQLPHSNSSPYQQPVYIGQGQHMYTMYPPATVKPTEPILAPGELPAPRPTMSYAALIGEALLLAPPPHHLYVSEISESIKARYACEYPL